jgi:hypothetical protein
VRMDLRWHGDDTNRIGALAQELVGLQPDVILAGSTPATVALQRETRTIPSAASSRGSTSRAGISRASPPWKPRWRQVARAALGDCAWAQAGRNHVQSRHGARIVFYALI